MVHPGPVDGPMTAACKPFREGEHAYFEVHDQLYALESFHRLAQHPSVIHIVREALGETAFPHPLAVLRLVFPETAADHNAATPRFSQQSGLQKAHSRLIPLTDCPVRLGPLAVLRGSHRFGVMPLQHHLGPGNRAAKPNSAMEQLEWHGGDFELAIC